MFALSKEATIICAGIGSIIGVIPISIYLYLFKNSGGRNIFELNLYLFGKIIGGLLNLILSTLALFISVIVLYNLTMFVNLNYLVLTNKVYIAFLFILPVIYGVSKGGTAIAKLAQILIYVCVLFFVLSVVGLVEIIRIDNLLPMFTSSLKSCIYSVLTYVALNTVPLFLILCVSKKDMLEDKNFSKRVYLTYFLSSLSTITVFFITLSGLGYSVVAILKYPEFLILKQISYGKVIERVENILSIYFILPMLITTMFSVYYSFVNFNMYCNNKVYKKSLVYILPLIVFFISMNCFENMTISTNFNMKFLPLIIGGVAMGIHLLLFLRVHCRKKF